MKLLNNESCFQVVIEESWTRGEQTIDVSKAFPGCPYIMNFCNMTQVRTNSGVVRPIRRLPQVTTVNCLFLRNRIGNFFLTHIQQTTILGFIL